MRVWQARHDKAFFSHLAATGDVHASARAAGFSCAAAWERRQRLPGFAWAWDKGVDEAALKARDEPGGGA